MNSEIHLSKKSIEDDTSPRRALGICAAATLAIQLSSCSTHTTEQHIPANIYETYAAEELIPLHDVQYAIDTFNEDTSLLTLHTEGGQFNPETNNIPAEYLGAFRALQNEPIIQLANKHGAVKTYSVTVGEYDAGWYRNHDRSVEFILGTNNNGANLYNTVLGFVATGVHEASHGLTFDWAYDNVDLASERSAEHKAAIEACSAVRDDVLNNYITANRSKIAAALRQTAGNFRATLYNHDSSVALIPQDEERKQLNEYINAFTATANALENETEIVTTSDDSCDYVSAVNALFDSKSRSLIEDYTLYPESSPLVLLANEQAKDADEAYYCVKDGQALGDIDPKSKSQAGHPYSNFAELTASTMTIFALNPSYALECMDKLEEAQPERAAMAWEMLENTWSAITAAQPEMRVIVRGSEGGVQLLSRLDSNL